MASTGTVVRIWRHGDVFHAERAEAPPGSIETCCPPDLSAVIADLAGLDLDDGTHASEAIKLAAAMRQRFDGADSETDLDDRHAQPGPAGEAARRRLRLPWAGAGGQKPVR